MASTNRVRSLDVLRGGVMVLMAIDHVRVYSGLPAGGPTAGIFFTRWVTHFCAPAFAFLAGTSAFLYGRKLARAGTRPSGHRGALARYLVSRGLVLVLLELTVIRVAWTFNLDFAHYILAGVIWMLGWCLILLAALVQLPMAVVAAIGAIVVAVHNVVDPMLPTLAAAAQASALGWLWQILYFGPNWPTDGPFVVLYSLVPWIGVMALGYAFGVIVEMEAARRRRWCHILAIGAIVVFAVLRATDLYGDPRPWNGASVLNFLNTTKYPASLQFLLMTLGPTIALLPWAERAQRPTRALAVFGRVPFFYYLLHIPLIHALAVVVSYAREGHVNGWLFANHPMRNPPPPDGYTWSLPLLYIVFVATIAMLYPVCRWFAEVKARNASWWVKYV